MVDKVESLFDALHEIILMFFFKLAVFTPALTNAILVGFSIGFLVKDSWGWQAGTIAGVTVACAIETAGVILSWNMSEKTHKVLVTIYVVGSWLLIWVGLNDDWVIRIVGSIMPVFAVAVQWTISSKKQQKLEEKRQIQLLREEKERLEKETQIEIEKARIEAEAEQKRQDAEIVKAQEVTKQERAKLKAIKASGNRRNTGNEPEIPQESTPPPVEQIMEEFGVGKSRAYEIRKAYTNGHQK